MPVARYEMKTEIHLIRQAFATFETEQYDRLLSALSLNDSCTAQRNSFNTVFCKDPLQVDSYDYFRTIRRTSAHNAYFHIPFCRTACHYCSYEKVTNLSPGFIEGYLRALEAEIRRKHCILGDNFRPDIFYLGGGTPTVLPPKAMEAALDMLGRWFDFRDSREFTVETTPQAILSGGDALLAVLKDHGVNRINVGVQSFSEKVARMNGRIQSADDIFACFSRLREAGFPKINLDLMYGIVGQTPEDWFEDLQSAVSLQPDSLTTFSLRVRPPSPLNDKVRNGEVSLPDERTVLVMRIMAQQYMPEAGYSEDNADYFIKSPEKRYLYQPFQPHNVNRNLIGFGPSAYSLAGDRQIFNVRSTLDYLRMMGEGRDPIGEVIELSRGEHIRQRFAEGIRTVFDDRSFADFFGTSIHDVLAGVVDRLRDLNLIEESGEELRLTLKGKVLHDHVAAFIKYGQPA